MERYKSANLSPAQVSVPSESTAGMRTATSEIKQNLASLSDRLQGFSEASFKMAEIQASDRAKKQAAMDDADMKPFHEESIYTVYGNAYNESRSASYAAKSELELDAAANQFYAQSNGNPKTFRESMDAFTKKLSSIAPTEELKSVIGITGRKLTNNGVGKLEIKRAADLKQNRIAEFERTSDLNMGQLINAIVEEKTSTADLIKHKMQTHLSTMVNTGDISEAEAFIYRKSGMHTIDKGVQEATMLKLLKEGKQEEAKKLLTNEIPENKTYKEQMEIQTSLQKIYNAKLKQDKASNALLKKSIEVKANEEIDALVAGKNPKDTVSELEYEVLDVKQKRKLQVQRDVSKIVAEYSDKTIQEQEAILMEYLKSDEGTKLDVDVQKALKNNLNARKTMWQKDPMTQGEIEGLYKNDIPFSVNNLNNVIKQRTINAEINVAASGFGGNKLFKQSEVEDIKNYLQNADFTTKSNLIQSIASHGRETSNKIFNQITDKKTAGSFAFAGRLSTQGKRNAASIALQGHGADVSLEEGYKKAIQDKIQGIFTPHTASLYNETLTGLIDYSKGLTVRGEEVTQDDLDDYLEDTIGAVTSINNKKTLLPAGVDVDTFETFLDEYEMPDNPAVSKIVQNITDTFGGNDYQLHYKAPGEYLLYNPDFAGTNKYVGDENGKPIIIKWSN